MNKTSAYKGNKCSVKLRKCCINDELSFYFPTLYKKVCSSHQALTFFFTFYSQTFQPLAITQLNKWQRKVLSRFNCTHFLCTHCPQTLNYKNYPKKKKRDYCPSISTPVVIIIIILPIQTNHTEVLDGELEEIKTIICDHCQASSSCFNEQKSREIERERGEREREREWKANKMAEESEKTLHGF